MSVRGVVRRWDEGRGWGVVDSNVTPGGCWVHYSVLVPSTFWAPDAGTPICFEFEKVPQDGFEYRATKAWPTRPEDTLPSTPINIVVDDEEFNVVEVPDRKGGYHFAWVTGPNPDYGFSVYTSDRSWRTADELTQDVRDFLAMIDPQTGYVSDDEDDDLRGPGRRPLGWPPRDQ